MLFDLLLILGMVVMFYRVYSWVNRRQMRAQLRCEDPLHRAHAVERAAVRQTATALAMMVTGTVLVAERLVRALGVALPDAVTLLAMLCALAGSHCLIYLRYERPRLAEINSVDS